MNNHVSLSHLLSVLSARLLLSGRVGTVCAYRSAVNSACKVLGTDMPASGLFSPEGVHLYEKRLYANGVSNNTVSFYMRMLRAIYNKGVDLGLCSKQPHLFDGVYTGIDATPKRAVSPDVFGILQSLDLSGKASLTFSRDLFLLSFCLQGISFVDLAYLRKSDLRGGLLTYHRAKTGGAITVALPALAYEIIERYTSQTSGSIYLLPIIKDPDGDTRLQYKSALRAQNRRLQKLGELAGLSEHLTSYVARHTWATVARHENVPIGLISQAMGHKTESVTQIYLARFDYSELYQANEKILAAAKLVSDYVPVDNEAIDINKKNVSHFWSERHFRLQT